MVVDVPNSSPNQIPINQVPLAASSLTRIYFLAVVDGQGFMPAARR